MMARTLIISKAQLDQELKDCPKAQKQAPKQQPGLPNFSKSKSICRIADTHVRMKRGCA